MGCDRRTQQNGNGYLPQTFSGGVTPSLEKYQFGTKNSVFGLHVNSCITSRFHHCISRNCPFSGQNGVDIRTPDIFKLVKNFTLWHECVKQI